MHPAGLPHGLRRAQRGVMLMTKKQKKELWIILTSAVLYAAVILMCEFIPFKDIFGKAGGFFAELVLYLIPYAIVGADVYRTAWYNIRRGDIFDENMLMLVATVGAIGSGNLAEAVAVMLFYQVGELFQSIAVNRSRQSISDLMDIMPESANLVRGDEVVTVDPEDVLVGETIVIRPGERIPLDCRVTKGSSMIDTSALTGESVPKRAEAGDELISGCINGEGVLYAEVQKLFDDSTVARIMELVESASEKKAHAEQFITRFARYYTPAVVMAAVLLAVIPPVFAGNFVTWMYRACTFLVVSCPCALVISVPMSFFCGIGSASKNGILVKGSNYLEQLAALDTVVMDKTGTLTRGEFRVTAIYPEPGIAEQELLQLGALAEVFSTHPAGAALRAAWKETSGQEAEPESSRVSDVSEIPGCGVRAVIDGRTVFAGNEKLMAQAGAAEGAAAAEEGSRGADAGGTVVFLASDERYLGRILISDTIKEGASEAIRRMKKLGIRQTVMLTGDRQEAARAVAEELGIDLFYAELLPADKVDRVEELLQQLKSAGKKKQLAFAGDGINDAPVLMRSDIGIAMGSMGSDAAIEAADVVLMDDSLLRIPLAVRIARKTVGIVRQNIVFALGVKFAVLILTAFGFASMWAAVFADVGVAVIAILNAMRAMFIKE